MPFPGFAVRSSASAFSIARSCARRVICAAWLRDLAAVASGAEEVVFNRDRLEQLRAQATNVDATAARQGVALVQETRRGLELNVSEELALEALFFRLEALFAG